MKFSKLAVLVFVSLVSTVPALAQTVSRVDITADNTIIVVGRRVTALARAKDADGNVIPNIQMTWASRNLSIATVDGAGVVTPLFPGSVQITARAPSGVTGTITFTAVPARVEVTGTSAVRLNSSTTLRARALDVNNNAISNVTFAWATDNTAVATVTAAGVVQAVGLGQCFITATVNGYLGRMAVTVERSQDFTLQTVVTSDAVQGPESPIQSIISVSNINSRGDVAFVANLGGSTAAVLRDVGGQITAIARTGNPAPLGGVFASFGVPVINGRGDVAFIANVSNGLGPLLLLARGSELVILLVNGDTLEVGGTITSITLGADGLDDNGNVAVTLNLSNPTHTGVFRVSADQGAVPLVRSFDELSLGSPTAINQVSVAPAGRTAVLLSFGTRRGIYILSPNAADPVIVDGAAAPGGGTFAAFLSIRSASDSDLYFMATPQGASTSLYRMSSAGVQEVVHGGREAASNRTITFTTLLSARGGALLFLGTVSDIGTGLFSWIDGNLRAAAVRNASLPGGEILARVEGGSINAAGEATAVGGTNEKLSAIFRVNASEMTLRWGTGSRAGVAANYHVLASSTLRPASGTTYFLAGFPAGLFKKTGDTVTPIAIPGLTTPRGEVFTSVTTASSNASGDIAFVATSLDLTRSVSSTRMYQYIGNTLTEWFAYNVPVAVSGMGNQTITINGLTTIGFNSARQAALVGTIGGRQSLLLVSSDIRVLLQSNTPAPTGGNFSTFTNIQITPSGAVAFTGGVQGAVGGIYLLNTSGQVIPIATTADYRGIGPPAVGGETVYFVAGRGDVTTALWSFTNGVVQQVIGAGAATPINTALTGIGSYSGQEDGSVVFAASAFFGAVFTRRADGSMQTLALSSETTPVSGRFSTFGNVTIANSVVQVNSLLTQDRVGLFIGLPQGGQITPSLSTDFSVANRGAVSLRTEGQSSAITVGYANVRVSAGNSSPAGLAIFSFRQGNTLVSEATVPATPLVQSGRVYAEVTTLTNTGIAIANPNTQNAAVSFYFTNLQGQNFGSGTTSIAPGGQIAKFLSEAPFNGGSSISGTFTFTSSVPVSVIALRGFVNERSEYLLTTLPVGPITQTSSDAVIFPHYADGQGWKTQVILVNPADDTLSGTGQFIGTDINSGFTYSIPPRSSFVLPTSGAGSILRSGWVRVTPASGTRSPSGLLIFSFKQNGITVSEASVPASPVSRAFRLYTEVVGNVSAGQIGAIQTGLAIANPSGAPVTVTFDLANLSGASSGITGAATVPPQGQIAMFANQITGFQNLLVAQGTLRISATAPVAVMGLRGRYNERNDFLITTVQPSNETVTSPVGDIYMPHFVDSGGYSTQFILYSGGTNQTSSGSLRFFSQSGQPLSLTLR